MDTSDKELFDSALEDQVTEVAADEPAAEVAESDGNQPRDESGRFAPKEQPAEVVAEASPEAAPPPKDEAAMVPSWRLREIREEREATERRFSEAQAQWQRQIAELQAKLPKQEAAPAPDVFENPNAFLEHGVKQAVDPINSQITALREEYSKKWAVKEHGSEKVTAAYNAVAQGMQTRDPEVMAVYQRAMASMDPYDAIVAWHSQKTVFQQIGADPNAWFEKQLEERMKDPTFQAQMLNKTQQSVRSNPSTPKTIQRPPSLNRVAAAAGNDDADNDMSDGALFAHATR